MNELVMTSEFEAWLTALTDERARGRIASRIQSAGLGHFGDCKPVGAGVSEMRIHTGSGYRVYYARRGRVVYLLLCGGDKSSQKRDVGLAKSILGKYEKGESICSN
jgi:putative addiction module killer protein